MHTRVRAFSSCYRENLKSIDAFSMLLSIEEKQSVDIGYESSNGISIIAIKQLKQSKKELGNGCA